MNQNSSSKKTNTQIHTYSNTTTNTLANIVFCTFQHNFSPENTYTQIYKYNYIYKYKYKWFCILYFSAATIPLRSFCHNFSLPRSVNIYTPFVFVISAWFHISSQNCVQRNPNMYMHHLYFITLKLRGLDWYKMHQNKVVFPINRCETKHM